MQANYLILFQPRSGSSWLTSMLAENESWSARYELLSYQKFPINGEYDQVEFLESFYRGDGEDYLVRGLKVAPFQIIDKPAVVDFLNKREVLAICLTRRNSVKAAVSAIRADQLSKESQSREGRGRTNLGPGDSVPPATAVPVDRFLKELRRLDTEKNNVHLMERSLDRTIEINYEELCDDPLKVKKRIEDAVDASLPTFGRGEIKKMTPDDLSKAISNYQEIAECLESSKYREQLEN